MNKDSSENYISQESLIRHLDTKVINPIKICKDFNRDVLEQFFNKIQKSPAGDFKLEDFIQIWLEADNSLRKNIEEHQKIINDY